MALSLLMNWPTVSSGHLRLSAPPTNAPSQLSNGLLYPEEA